MIKVSINWLLISSLLVCTEGLAQGKLTSRFNQLWLDAIVSIEIATKDGGSQALGTGFLIESPNKNLVLVTARHVIEPVIANTDGISYFLTNHLDEDRSIAETALNAEGYGQWYFSDSEDLAIRYFAWPKNYAGAYIPQESVITQNRLQAGAPVLVLGFPLGLRDIAHSQPIVRRGVVARVDEGNTIVDAFVFPGNSGGPVVYVPPIKSGNDIDKLYVNEEKLVGVVSSFIPYREKAISQKTGRTRVVFEENTGLTNVVPASSIHRLMQTPEIVAFEASLSSL